MIISSRIHDGVTVTRERVRSVGADWREVEAAGGNYERDVVSCIIYHQTPRPWGEVLMPTDNRFAAAVEATK